MKVFIGCSSRENIPDKYFNDCEKLLDELFKLNNDLVFGAYNKGLMALSYDKATTTYTIKVKVTNTGDVAGKETVQIYVSSPYTNYDKENTITPLRRIDKNLIELNKQGFLNGHTPFSSMVAFLSYLTAYLYDKKYIALSNESSANESNVEGTKINHQYSKTYEFESDFNYYTKKFFNIDILYFSLLRPLSEYQIGMLFSKYEKYHPVFKSCNVGSKGETWQWCCDCPKCLFVYSILSPHLYKEKLVNIFGKDMFENESLLTTFKELLGRGDNKPFECVGTYEEVNYAISKTIKQLEQNNETLPYLLQYYKDNYELLDTNKINLEDEYNEEHHLNNYFEDIIKKAINYDK